MAHRPPRPQITGPSLLEMYQAALISRLYLAPHPQLDGVTDADSGNRDDAPGCDLLVLISTWAVAVVVPFGAKSMRQAQRI